MRTKTLKYRIQTAFAGIILIFGACIFALGFYVIKYDVFGRTQQQIELFLNSARTFYEEEINRIGASLEAADLDASPQVLEDKLRLDYFYRVAVDQASESSSEIVREVVRTGQPLGGTRVISREELEKISPELQQRSRIDILDTEKARPTNMKVLETALTKEFALPLKDDAGQVREVVYAGRIINHDHVLVDRIRKLVFGNAIYKDKPVGTVTIFMDDVRISTNVLDEKGHRAIGTRVSDEVYSAVVEDGNRWLDSAFVVTHKYLTGYEPIRTIDGKIVGILYVGILEEPFNDMTVRIVLSFILVIVFGALLAFVFSLILTGSIVKPMTEMLTATRKMADGQLGHEVTPDKTISELNQFAKSFNEMSFRLKERENSLKLSNDKMAELNKSYLDLLGFVAHELKGLLSSAVINAYSIRDGFLGMINFKQKKAVVSICRNLDFLDATVKKFLNLSRIERGNLEVNRTLFSLGKDIFAMSVETFSKMAQDRQITISNQIDPALKVKADMDLMQIVANNLVNNAIKYGQEGGKVLITTKDKGGFVTVEVYNDSTPIPADKIDQLFKKFSRLDMPSKKKVKGTGLGLYITKQIVEAHGGNIRVEAKENGNSFIFTISKE